MPEGPSIVILKEECAPFKGQKVISVSGNAKQDLQSIGGKKILDFKSWGKQFLICFEGFYIRIHLLLFGSYRINEKREMSPRLSLQFKNGELNIYNGSVRIMPGKPEDVYDWQVDTMAPSWNPERAFEALQKIPRTMVCDALLDQNIFAGSGNIIKNEVLFLRCIHPETLLGKISPDDKQELIKTLRAYCFDFYRWKKAFVLRKHWLIYRAKNCPRCGTKTTLRICGKTKRKSHFCPVCQVKNKKSDNCTTLPLNSAT